VNVIQPPRPPMPIVTRLLLISWLIPQVLVTASSPALEAWLVQHFALIPAHVSAAVFGGGDIWSVLTFASSTFLHAGWFHLGANALFMLMIAPPLERGLGAAMFFSIYVLTSLAAGLAQWLSAPGDFIAIVGASGGISGLFGAYAVLFARSTLPDKYVLGFRVSGATLYVLWQLAAWLGLQALTAFMFNQGGGGVAVWAHIGGFVVGLICGLIVRHLFTKGSYSG
jgi:membrane associated rhomboid family serine protease